MKYDCIRRCYVKCNIIRLCYMKCDCIRRCYINRDCIKLCVSSRGCKGLKLEKKSFKRGEIRLSSANVAFMTAGMVDYTNKVLVQPDVRLASKIYLGSFYKLYGISHVHQKYMLREQKSYHFI